MFEQEVISNICLNKMASDTSYRALDAFSTGRIIFGLCAFMVILVGVYLFTRFVAGKSLGINKNSEMVILDQMSISGNSKILIVEIFQKTYILAVTNDKVEVIDKIASDSIQSRRIENSDVETYGFQSYFDKMLKKTDANNDNSDEDKNLNYKMLGIKNKLNFIKRNRYETEDFDNDEYKE